MKMFFETVKEKEEELYKKSIEDKKALIVLSRHYPKGVSAVLKREGDAIKVKIIDGSYMMPEMFAHAMEKIIKEYQIEKYKRWEEIEARRKSRKTEKK